MNRLVLIAGGSTLVYALLATLMGVLPGIELSRTPAGPGVVPLTPLEAAGRDVYVASGCSYCHTQQVRPLAQDKVFGRPSAPGDFAYQTPELLGSQRTGPDLTNIGVRQPSAVWQYIHLYNPRAVVPESVMPSFDWLFDVVDQAPAGVTPVPLPKAYAPAGGVVVPTRDAQALLAYLMALKQPALPDTASAGGAMPAMAGVGASAGTAPPSTGAGAPAADGKALFTANCAACHQASGEGLPGAFPPLKGNAAVNDADATTHIRAVLHGVHGVNVGGTVYPSPMPPFAAALSDAEIAAIINFERSSWGNHGAAVTAAQVAAERAKGK
ncbi:MAG TPA: cbb3-type cytochrome c oxidase subunit II [Burkholderiaceae bacterium]|nr:cbb3-type cytochrome c oxidase subunit II [Burkholderiaceae bacterium]